MFGTSTASRRNCRNRLAMAIAFVLFSFAGANWASAQSAASPSPLEERRDQLFVATLNDPDNLDVAFEYALVAAKLGDYEGAIATLERMLVFAPNLPRVQLELGVLYYRIGANDMARQYLEAVSREQIPPEVRSRVETFLAAIDRQDRRFLISGQVSAGVQYQSNANAAPGEDSITIDGVPVQLNSDARARSDWSLFGLGRVHMSYDLRNQGDLIEADVVTYQSYFAEQHRLNLGLIEVQVGPTFGLGRIGYDPGRIGVYAILGANALGNSIYSSTYGAGTRFQSRFGERFLYDGRNEVRVLNYDNSDDYPTVRIQTGEEYRHWSQITALWSPQWTSSASFAARWVDAREDFKTFGEVEVTANTTYRFYGPTYGPLADGVPWALSLTGGLLYRGYDGPDPFLDPDESEEDFAIWGEAGVSMPIEYDFSVFLTGQLRHQASNYETREYTNAIVTLGLTKRF